MDSYAPCPCGSGKKVKFCCQAILPDMAKIVRFQENNQFRMALQLIEKLQKDHPDNAWLTTQRAMALLNEERVEEARDVLVEFLRKNEDHPLANALLALVMTELKPVGECKKVLHRAFLKSMNAEPRTVALLAERLAEYYLGVDNEMAARQHLAVALRFEQDEERERVLMALLELDAETSVPYPLRGGHPLPQYTAPDELAAKAKKAQRLYVHACFSEAADLLDQVAEQETQSAELFHMIGLMRAWDGDETRAASALHQAARLYNDFDRAVDVETVAQLLDKRDRKNCTPARTREYEVESLSRLLTRLDNEDRLYRIPNRPDVDSGYSRAQYFVLDRPLPSQDELSELTLDTLPQSLGEITLYELSTGEAGQQQIAILSGVEGDALNAVTARFEEAAGELAKPAEIQKGREDSDIDVVRWYSPDELAMKEETFMPPDAPPRLLAQLHKQLVERTIHDRWMNTELAALGGKSPQAAAGDESLKVPLAAAVQVLDAYLDQRDIMLDQQALFATLNLPAPQKITSGDDLDLHALSLPQLMRLDTQPLSDEAFDRLVHRGLIIKHCGFGYRLLKEYLTNRPQLVEKNPAEAQKLYSLLVDICGRSLRIEEALDWTQRGIAFSKSHDADFQTILLWKMREMTLRARNPDDPELKELLLDLWNNYGAKLPVVRERLQELVSHLQLEAPWQQSILTPESGGTSGGGLWTSESEQTSGEKKLWLPD